MQDVFVVADNVFSPFGKTTVENFDKLKQGISGIQEHQDIKLSADPFNASLFKSSEFADNLNQHRYTKFERLLIASVADALSQTDISPADEQTVLIVSSTKGNISIMNEWPLTPDVRERISIPHSANLVAGYFGFVNQPVIISNACISGIVAVITGMRLIRSGRFKNAVIAGADEVSKFILSGFQAFQAVSAEPCKPFDADRTGITLGEGSATIILSSRGHFEGGICVKGGSVSNDANHISAPSRTGEELQLAIANTITEAKTDRNSIDFISAHGTATLYNDEMEAKAIALSGLQDVPLNSLKGFYGHTLGAAGLIESVITMQSMRQGIIIPTRGFKKLGVSDRINVCRDLQKMELNTCLKTASGFGGCNAALLLAKN